MCTQLRDIPQLAGGFNAVGFSQGGQFMRVGGDASVCKRSTVRRTCMARESKLAAILHAHGWVQ